EQAFLKIEDRLKEGGFETFLLHGVTGSGKTEVYLRAMEQARRAGRGSLILIPEISLTPQLIDRVNARFPGRVGILHSALSAAERWTQWWHIVRGNVDVVVGARSAVFAPLANLGLIVVDEEHDTSYKQEETPRYHARDVAIVRAQQCRAVVVLGSATPALETFHNARSGKYLALSLPQRVEDKPLPSITVIDQRAHATPNERVIATPLYQAIAACLQRQEQCLILINRRGFASYLQCRDCGVVPQC